VARGSYDIKVLARTINRRREEYNRKHPDKALPITSALSRILENDEEYVPYRTRAGNKRRRPAVNPGIFTLVEIAAQLGTTVGDLLGERAFRVTTNERRKLREFVLWLTALFDLDAVDLTEPGSLPKKNDEKPRQQG
jgi:hypothetical protein